MTVDEMPNFCAWTKEDRIIVAPIGEGLTRAELRFGFMEEPNVPQGLADAMARGKIPKFDLGLATYYTGHETIVPLGRRQELPPGRRPCSPSCTTTPSDPAPISRSPARRSWRSGLNLRFKLTSGA